MSRIRTIKPEFWVDDAMVDQPFEGRLLFLGLLNFVDDEGLIEYKPKRIKMQVFPADSVSTHALLESLIESNRLEVIESDQGTLLHVVNFHRHQVVNRPTPTKFTGLPASLSLKYSGALTESSQGKGKEGKGKERSKAKATSLPSDWQPTSEHLAKAKELGVDVEREAATFRLHAEANDRKAVRWNAAFSMWLTKARPSAPPRKPDPDAWMNR